MNAEKLTSVVPEAVRQLLERRSTYREWLSRLDEVGGKYRSEVAERVRVDYEARLDGVGEELAEHHHELAASLERRRARLDELTEAFERHSAELEEAELRFQVGEFDEATWEETRAKLAESIEDVEGELEEARSAVGELERVLGELAGGTESGGATVAGRARAAPAAAAAKDAAVATEVQEATEATDTSDANADVAADATEADVPTHGEAPDETDADEPVAAAVVSKADVASEADEAGEADEADVTADAEVAASVGSATERASDGPDGGSEDYLDELEFLESLSLDDPDSFDAVSRMLEEEEDR